MTDALAQLQFLRPDWLWALLALPLLAAGWWWRRRQASVWHRHVDAHLLPHLLEPGTTRSSLGGLLLRLLAWTLAVLALAGPSWRHGEVPLHPQGRALVIAIDLSDAMLASDLPPSRMLQARAKLATLLRERGGGEVALVAFADDAYTVAPLTADAANVALFLDALAPEVMPAEGHRPDRAVLAAMRLLEQAGHSAGDILLLSHAADAATMAAARRAAAAGFRVSVLGLGTAAGATYRAQDGSLRPTRLDAASLQRVATAGGGRYAALSAGNEDLVALQVLSGEPAPGSAAGSRSEARIARDEGWWLLPPLMLLALLAFRRGAGIAVLAACLLLPLPQVQAQTQLPDAPAGTPWRRADQVGHARMREALDAYRAGRFAEAAQTFQALPGDEAAYNRGNALARDGRLEAALEAYDEALRVQPEMADAIHNRAVVEAALRRNPPPGDGQSRQQQDADNERKGAGAAGDEDTPDAPPAQSQGEPGSDAPQTPPSTPPDDPPERDASPAQTPTGSDAQAQDQADAAQRQRMEQALAEDGQPAEQGERAPGDPEQAESEAERERRQAGEAWLRRVPDDPGGLLRARFRLEHQRRHGGGPIP
ncbi:VWA domain-containing protein [Luteimonas sp. A611]